MLTGLLGAAGWQFHAALRREQATVALVTAVKKHDTPAAIAALNAGADPNVRDDHDVTPKPSRYYVSRLWNAMRGRHEPAAQEVGDPMLMCALRDPTQWDLRLVKALLDKGANPEMGQTDVANLLTETPLSLAIGNYDGIDDYGSKAWQQRKPLSYVLIALLLQHGGNPNRVDFYSSFYESEDLPVVQLLFAYGATLPVHVPSDSVPPRGDEPRKIPLLGWNPEGDEHLALEFLKHGADVNALDVDSKTMLMRAAEVDNAEVVRLLVQHGAKINLISEHGTALDYATGSGNENGKRATTIRFLLAHGAKTGGHIAYVIGRPIPTHAQSRPEQHR